VLVKSLFLPHRQSSWLKQQLRRCCLPLKNLSPNIAEIRRKEERRWFLSENETKTRVRIMNENERNAKINK
jgi:hypothetical protein